LAFGIALAPPLAFGQVLVFAAVGCLGAGNGAVFQIVPQRFGNEIGIVSVLRAASGTFASGFITFGALALLGAILITLRGRVWSGTFLLGRPTSYAFAIEEG
jgi:NNP family nitrate/nitrite transporter-like MFS transporter